MTKEQAIHVLEQTARNTLRRIIEPDVDVWTVAKVMEQTGGLILADLADERSKKKEAGDLP